MVRLYTFNISHFSEKVRWVLDFEGIPYEERVLVPGPHGFVTRRLAPKSSVPLLVHGGAVVQESSAILDYITERLGGAKLAPKSELDAARTRALEKQVDHAFGLGVQRVLYSAALDDRAVVTQLWTAGGPWWSRAFYAVAYPGVAAVVKRMYKTTDHDAVERSKQLFLSTFDTLDAILGAQPYLGGDAPSRSDITVAALLAPLCRPPEHRVRWPETPAALVAFEAQLQGRPTWNHVLRLYREHRHVARSKPARLSA